MKTSQIVAILSLTVPSVLGTPTPTDGKAVRQILPAITPVPGVYDITWYDDAGFQGESKTWNAMDPGECYNLLDEYGWNDRISSFKLDNRHSRWCCFYPDFSCTGGEICSYNENAWFGADGLDNTISSWICY